MVNLDKLETINRIKALSKERGTSLTFMYKNGALEFGVGVGWIGGAVTIDIDEIFKIILRG